MEPRIEYVKTEDGVSIACTALGEGPTIVLASNTFGDLNMYGGSASWIAALLAAGRRVVLYDGRGAGASDRDALDASLETRIADLEAVVDRLGLERFALVGRGHGGPTAVAYAVRHPGKLTHLVLLDTYVRGTDYYGATAYMRAAKALTGVAVEDWEFFTATLGYWAVGFQDTERAQALTAAFRSGLSPQSYMKAIETSESVDVSAMLSEVSIPTLVIQNRGAVLSVPAAAKSLASTIPAAKLVSIRGFDEVAPAVLEFTAAKTETPASSVAAPASGGLRSVLFTDIVGHTAMMQRLGDAKGRDVLREHERITRETLKQHGGAEVKTMGDGFLASFGSVTSAVECAIALQRAFEGALTRPSGPPSPSGGEGRGEGVSIRIGLNAGEPIEEEGDLFGATVILASRIAAQAGAGEIFVPDTVRGLLSGKNFLFADRGEFALKGFDDAVRLYEVRWRER